ncbi:ATP-binding protein [Porcipelethomonas sp.]|uniref:ATP-binding protein n=1 Tax=Porcipelethomonas sp. TaxID=2981675 RepID=UPI003EF9300E
MNNIKLDYIVKNNDFANMGAVSGDVQDKLKEMGYSSEIVRKVSTALYQGEINMLIHAGGGNITIDINDEYIMMVLKDNGPGIDDIEQAMTEGYSTADEHARSLGFGEGTGFSSMKKYSDDMQIYSAPGEGTTVIMRVDLK